MEAKNVYQRIHAVMQDVEYLSKDDKVETGGGKFYKAVTEEKVTGAVRAAMVKHGLVVMPVRQEHERTDEIVKAWDKYNNREVEKVNRISTVNTEYRMQNIDDPNDYIILASSGTGVDTQDKGVGKAMTYSFKYMLLRTFAIPTGDDPDKISSDVYTEQLTGEAETRQSNVYDNKINELRADIKRAVPDPKTRDAASMKRFGKEFIKLDEAELSSILQTLHKSDAQVTLSAAGYET